MSKTADLLWVGAADFGWGVDSMRTVFSAAHGCHIAASTHYDYVI